MICICFWVYRLGRLLQCRYFLQKKNPNDCWGLCMYNNVYFFALGVGVVVAHAPVHVLQHRFCSEYAPFPANANPRAKTARVKSSSAAWNDHPLTFIAPSMITITTAAATRVKIPNTNNAPAAISNITSIQNHIFIDKNVSPMLWNAPPINPTACSAIGILAIPWYKNNHPIRRRRISNPTDLLHREQFILFVCKNIKNTPYM